MATSDAIQHERQAEPAAVFSMAPLSWLGAGSAIVGLVLFGLQQTLRLPSALDIEDFLGWSSMPAIQAALALWCPPVSPRWSAAAGYVLIDTAWFMPFYGALILAAVLAMRHALQPAPALMARWLARGLWPLACVLVAALWLVDGLENYGGAQRLGLSPLAFWGSAAIGMLLFVQIWRTVLAAPAGQPKQLCKTLGLIGAALLLTGLLLASQDATQACGAWSRGEVMAVDFGWAHRAKPGAIVLALLPLLFAALVWWFGIDLDLQDPAQRQASLDRAAWRAGVGGVIGRSRYVIVLLLLFAVFTLVLDQCRDVLLALARPAADTLSTAGAPLAWRVLVLVAGPLAVGALAHSCWLWTRLVGMVQRPDVALPGGPAVLGKVGGFARGWARALSLVPLVLMAVLIAQAVGDAAAAARLGGATRTAAELPWTLAYLAGFGLGVVLIGFVLVQLRMRLALTDPAHYYNSEPDVYALLRGSAHLQRELQPLDGSSASAPPGPAAGSCLPRLTSALQPLTRRVEQLAWLVMPLVRPTGLPLLALGAMCAVRVCMALYPDETSMAPATLVLLCLGLSWWCGVLGLLSLAEQRQAIPWSLALLAVAGLLALAGFADNHALPLTLLPSDVALQPTLVSLAGAGAQVTLLLGAAAALAWIAITWSRAPAAVHAPRASLLRWRLAGIGLAIVAMLVGLHVIDRRTAMLGTPATAAAPRPLDAALARWVAQLPSLPPDGSGDHRVFLVASEGGGIRSAYWTAQVLARLNELPGFAQRSFALSGVSGGAVGEAVYRACLRSAPVAAASAPSDRAAAIGRCAADGFRQMDALSPLIGAFLFEDVWARFLPLRLGAGGWVCGQPGCGYLSRGAGFEREWLRRFPALAEPIGPARPGEPQLLLNSTWVESGNRAVVSTLSLPARELPASEDVVRRLGAEPSLIASAHLAARFPFINPIAALRPASGASGAGRIVGHLADGGYHDNSGAASLADLWRALRKVLPPPWQPQLILIRNGQLRSGCIDFPADGPPVSCLRGQPLRQHDITEPLDKSQMNFYVDLLGPAVTVINVSGIGAHGRQAPAALAQDMADPAARCTASGAAGRVWLLDQTDEGTLVPLGWYLSPAAREALDEQARRVVETARAAPCR